MQKLEPKMMSTVLGKTWELDDDKPGVLRKPETWQDVAKAVELELDTRADIVAPTADQLRVFGAVSYTHLRAHETS